MDRVMAAHINGSLVPLLWPRTSTAPSCRCSRRPARSGSERATAAIASCSELVGQIN
uniref:Uncharacterized protein n=1 Tax=Arundo donax TaxID=35708 RepID=A0A0A9GWW9_ARUDO